MFLPVSHTARCLWCYRGSAVVTSPGHAAYPGLLSILLTSIVTQDVDAFSWAANQLSAALDTVSPDGTMAGVAGETNALYFQASGILMCVNKPTASWP